LASTVRHPRWTNPTTGGVPHPSAMSSGMSVVLALLAACAAPSVAAGGLSASGAAAAAEILDDATSLVQTKSQRVGPSRQGAGGLPELQQQASNGQLAGIEKAVMDGLWVQQLPPTAECGKASFSELGTPIPRWKEANPGVDPFCHFQNYAYWFQNAGSITSYHLYGRQGRIMTSMPSPLCIPFLENLGPARTFNFSNGDVMRWEHMDGCIDAVDDPYCYSLGWLKGQNLDDTDMSDVAAWSAKGKKECQRIQDTYNFLDEEVTVGHHIFNTPEYLRTNARTVLGLSKGNHRLHNQHAYTKCQLGDALGEMAYCYYRGCVLPDGSVSHGSRCGYK